MSFYFRIIILLVAYVTFSSGQQPSTPGPIAFDNICEREQGTENFACPRADGVLQCLSLSQICDGIEDCSNGAADEGRNINSLDCKWLQNKLDLL